MPTNADTMRKAAGLLFRGYKEALGGDGEEIEMLATEALEILAGKQLPEDEDEAAALSFADYWGD